MDNLVSELDALAGERDTDPLDELRSVGQRLVQALTDQLADGQVEALYSLQGAAAQVKKTSADATAASEKVAVVLRDLGAQIAEQVAAGLAEFRTGGQELVGTLNKELTSSQRKTVNDLQAAADTITARTSTAVEAADSMVRLLGGFAEQVADDVSAGVRALITEATAQIGEQLAAEVDASSAELRGAALDHAQSVSSQLEVTSSHLTGLYDAAAARHEDAQAGLEWAAEQGRQQLTSAAEALQEHRAAGEAALAAAGEALAQQVRDGSSSLTSAGDAVAQRLAEGRTALDETGAALADRVRAAGAEAQEELSSGAGSAVEQLRAGVEELLARTASAREELAAALAEARAAAAEELETLRKQIAAAERREEAVADRLQRHVEELVARTDATVAQSLTHLRGVADALLERDESLEKRRVDEFARVLEVVLKEGGSSTRKLRDRIFRGMDAAKDKPVPTRSFEKPAAAPVVEPHAVAPEPVVEPTPEPEPKKPVAEKPVKAPRPVATKAAPKPKAKPAKAAAKPVAKPAKASAPPKPKTAAPEPAPLPEEDLVADPVLEQPPVLEAPAAEPVADPPAAEAPEPPSKKAPAKRKAPATETAAPDAPTTPVQEEQA